MKKLISYTFLTLGLITLILSNGVYLLWYAAFLFPIFFLLATDKMNNLQAGVLLITCSAIGNMFSFYNVLPDINIPFFKWIPALAGASYGITFIIQRAYFNKSTSFSTTLVLPILYTGLDLINAYFNPFGTFGLLGYSQHNNIIMLQLVPLVGAIGLTFLITWFGTTCYWMIRNKKLSSFNPYNLGFMLIIILILTFSGIRLISDNQAQEIQLSGIHTLDRTVEETAQLFSDYENDLENFHKSSNSNIDLLTKLIKEEIQLNADIIHLSETTLLISEQQESDVKKHFQALAKTNNVTLLIPMYIMTDPHKKHENILYLISSKGEILFKHYKYGGSAFEASKTGDKVLNSSHTEHGILSAAICWDKDFPFVMEQIGTLNVDTLFLPSADWKEISPYHTIVGNFRGMENGSNTVTQALNGMSMIVDYKGRVISKMDHFSNDKWITRGRLPKNGTRTLYPKISQYIKYILIIMFVSVHISLSKRNKEN